MKEQLFKNIYYHDAMEDNVSVTKSYMDQLDFSQVDMDRIMKMSQDILKTPEQRLKDNRNETLEKLLS
jgi:hypothetical protein